MTEIISERRVDSEKSDIKTAPPKVSPLDDLDKRLLSILQDDARASASEISRKTGFNENTIRYRIERLKKNGVIKEFTALLNPRMIGLPIAAIMMITTEPNSLKEVFENLAMLEETKHILQATGKHDLIVVAHYKDMNSMNDASQKIKSIPGVKEAEIHLATGMIKVDTKFNMALL
ncbi:MAG: Lrp/AsnC family transcriptional regulator [Nitrososphaerales archaeon]